jgi:hypothetical protein
MTATLPVEGSPLNSYWGSDSSQHVNYIGTDGHLHELYIAPGSSGWVDHDLTALTDTVGPVGDSPLVGYWGSDGSQHVVYIDNTDGHVQELSIAPGSSGWMHHDLTVLAGAALPNGDSALVGYWGSDGSQHVNFVAGDEHVHELYRAPGSRGWEDNDLTKLAGGVASGINRLDGYWGSDDSQHVNFTASGVINGDIHELYISPGTAGWLDNNLTKLAGAVATASESPLDGYWGTDNSQHVNFIGVDGHVHEFYIAPGNAGWVDNDLTKLAGAAPLKVEPVAETALSAYWGSDNSQHVNYIGADGHLHELYIAPGNGWVDNDLTKLANGVLPANFTPLHGYWGSDNSQHVNFIGTDGHIHELYLAPGATGWVDNDLTKLA